VSRAFVKEDAPEPDDAPPERPVSPHPNYCTPRGLKALEDTEARLVTELTDYAGTQPDPARRRRKRELERDLRYVRARLETAIPVPSPAAPREEVRFGAAVTLRDSGGRERRLVIVGEDEAEAGGDLLPWPAPLAQSLYGLKRGAAVAWDGRSWTVAAIE
jgi:transcription elongation factor GreB